MSKTSGLRMNLRAALRVVTLHVLLLMFVAVTMPAGAAYTACSDGIDNDLDGKIDYPEDDECTSLLDDSEGPTGKGLFLSLTDGADTVKPLGSLNYKIRLLSDRDSQRNIGVRLFVPQQVNLTGISDGGRRVGNFVHWDNVTVYPKVLRELYVSAEISPYAKEGLLIVSEAEAEGERVTDTTRVVSEEYVQPNMRVSVTDGRDAAKPGETLSYKIVVTNDSTEPRTFNLRAMLPYNTSFVSASNNAELRTNTIQWPSITLPGKQQLTERLDVRIIDRAPEFYSIRMRAVTSFGLSAVDDTSVMSGLPQAALSVELHPDRPLAAPGEEITYRISIDNRTPILGTEVWASMALPMYTEFVSATEGGEWVGENVRWRSITVSPNGSRSLTVVGRVRSDAPAGAVLTANVTVNGRKAFSDVAVSDRPTRRGSYARTRPEILESVFVQKFSDRTEVQPGSTLTYTVVVRNTTGDTVHNLNVTDRFDAKYMTVISGADEALATGDALLWTISELAPNETWKRSYVVRVARDVPNETSLNNVVTVTGKGLETLSLTQRVRTYRTHVVSGLPRTGAAMDLLYVLGTAALGVGQVALQRRRIFSK